MTFLADKPISPNNLPEVDGWKPPIIYDVSSDQWRLVTQADIDTFTAMSATYGTMRSFLQKEHDALMSYCRVIKEKA